MAFKRKDTPDKELDRLFGLIAKRKQKIDEKFFDTKKMQEQCSYDHYIINDPYIRALYIMCD